MKKFQVEHDIIKHIVNEVKIMYQFSQCPNIVKIYDHFEDDDYIYLQMEYCQGVTIAFLINRANFGKK